MISIISTKAALLIAAALVFAGAARAEDEVRVFSADLNAAPFVITDGVQFVSGIVKDLNDLVALRAGRRVSYHLVARRAVDDAFLSGDGHVECTGQPAWTGIADKLTWSKAIYTDTDRFWALAESADRVRNVATIADLKGLSFATYRDYRHSAPLTAQVAAGETKRVDLFPNQDLIDALTRKRSDVILYSEIRGDYELAHRRLSAQIVKTRLVDDEYAIFCALSPKFPGDAAAYLAAINGLVDDGSMARIMAKYR